MAQQIQKGTSYDGTQSGSQVTYQNLNQHVDNAKLLAGAIDDQTANPLTTNTDGIMFTKDGVLYKQTKGQFTDNITSSAIQVAALTAGGESVNFLTANKANSAGTFTTASGSTTITVTQNNHGFVVGEIIWVSGASLSSIIRGRFTVASVISTSQFTYNTTSTANTADSSFTSANGLLVTVTSNNHGLITGQSVVLTTSTAGYSGTYTITYVDANTFTYTLSSTQTVSSGTVSWTCTNAAITSTTNIAGVVDNSNVINNGPTEVYDSVLCYNTDGLKLPSGTTIQRPKQPANGYIRYNTDNNITEVYGNGTWQNIYSYQGAASSGGTGRWVRMPDVTKTFTGESWTAANAYVTTTEQTWTITIPVGEYWNIPFQRKIDEPILVSTDKNPINSFSSQTKGFRMLCPAGYETTYTGVSGKDYLFDYELNSLCKYVGQSGRALTSLSSFNSTYYYINSCNGNSVYSFGNEWIDGWNGSTNSPTGNVCCPSLWDNDTNISNDWKNGLYTKNNSSPYFVNPTTVMPTGAGIRTNLKMAWKQTMSSLCSAVGFQNQNGVNPYSTAGMVSAIPYGGFVNETYATQGWTIYQDSTAFDGGQFYDYSGSGNGYIYVLGQNAGQRWVMFYIIPSQTGPNYITPYGLTNMTLTIKRPSKYLYKNAKYAIQESLSMTFERYINI